MKLNSVCVHVTVKMPHGWKVERQVYSLSLWDPAVTCFQVMLDAFMYVRKECFLDGEMDSVCGSEL